MPQPIRANRVVLKVANKRYIGNLSSILTYCNGDYLSAKGTVREFTMIVPRPNFIFAPYRIKFTLRSKLRSEQHTYHLFSPTCNLGGVLEAKVHLFLIEWPEVEPVRETIQEPLYRL